MKIVHLYASSNTVEQLNINLILKVFKWYTSVSREFSWLLFCIINILRSALLVFVVLRVPYSGSTCKVLFLSQLFLAGMNGKKILLHLANMFSQTNFFTSKIHASQPILQFPYGNLRGKKAVSFKCWH